MSFQVSSGEAIHLADASLIQDGVGGGGSLEERKKEMVRSLVEKQTMESVNLEDALRENEVKMINLTLQEVDFLKKQAIEDLQKELKVIKSFYFEVVMVTFLPVSFIDLNQF